LFDPLEARELLDLVQVTVLLPLNHAHAERNGENTKKETFHGLHLISHPLAAFPRQREVARQISLTDAGLMTFRRAVKRYNLLEERECH